MVAHVIDLNDFYVVKKEDIPLVRKMNEDISRQGTFGMERYQPRLSHCPVVVISLDTHKW